MNVNFEYYRIFYYVAKYRNFTKAPESWEIVSRILRER